MSRASGYCTFDTAIGCCGIAWTDDGRLAGVQLPQVSELATRRCMEERFPQVPQADPPPAVEPVIGRIQGLLEGVRDPLLDVPLDMTSVPAFHQRVYEITRAIPPGRTMTYGEIAERLGEPGSARAVGQALGHNPFAPVVPCHRVLAAGGGAGGFSATGGIATKLRLLEIENAQLGPDPGLFDR